MAHLPPLSKLLLTVSAALALCALKGCQPRPAPPRLPPREVPQLQGLSDKSGQRGSVVGDAVPVGSNTARYAYKCGSPAGKGGITGSGVLSPTLSRCELDATSRTVSISAGSEDCPQFLLKLTDYHGPDTYNTSSLGALGFGAARLQQDACHFEADMCLNWNGAAGVHPEASCTVIINSDGGLQYGSAGATLSGTFACSAFVGTYDGCIAGERVVADCAIPRGSFSIAGCDSVNAPAPAAPAKAPGRSARRVRP